VWGVRFWRFDLGRARRSGSSHPITPVPSVRQANKRGRASTHPLPWPSSSSLRAAGREALKARSSWWRHDSFGGGWGGVGRGGRGIWCCGSSVGEGTCVGGCSCGTRVPMQQPQSTRPLLTQNLPILSRGSSRSRPCQQHHPVQHQPHLDLGVRVGRVGAVGGLGLPRGEAGRRLGGLCGGRRACVVLVMRGDCG
jgi:hypothetical protein